MGTGLLGNPELSVALLYLPVNTCSATLCHSARELLQVLFLPTRTSQKFLDPEGFSLIPKKDL